MPATSEKTELQNRLPGPPVYEGMDRPPIGDGVPEKLLLRAVALEDLTPADAESTFQALRVDLATAGHDDYELLALVTAPSSAWEFLGYDVGEDTPRAWSALAHRDWFFADDERAARYLEAEDPDRGWRPDGWTDDTGIYTVVPVYRFHGAEPRTSVRNRRQQGGRP